MSADSRPVMAESLRKRFGTTQALDGLDLEVLPGEVHGFLGPNGAGKSTTIRALLGQIGLDGGRAHLFGLDCRRDSVRAHSRIAYVPGDVALWPGLTGGECIDILLRFNNRRDERRRDELVEAFELDTRKRTRSYSKGNRQKVALVAALSSGADLLLLDEPTSGLDPLMEQVFQDCVAVARKAGQSVLLSSHILAEVEALCDRVSIVRRGRIVSHGTLSELRSHTLVRVSAVTPHGLQGVADLRGVSGFTADRVPGGVHSVFRVTQETLGGAVGRVAELAPTSLTVEPPSLDELFIEQYRDQDDDIGVDGGAGSAALPHDSARHRRGVRGR